MLCWLEEHLPKTNCGFACPGRGALATWSAERIRDWLADRRDDCSQSNTFHINIINNNNIEIKQINKIKNKRE